MFRARSAAIDAVRIIGVVAVVAGHVWGDVPGVRALLYSWHVPVFFVLSGYLTSHAPLPTLIRRRARTLLLPYATWLVVLALTIPYAFPPVNLLLGGAYLTRPFSAFWFVTALFVAVVVAACIQRLPLWVQWVASAALLTAAYMIGAPLALVPWDAAVGAACVVFVIAGRTLRMYRERFPTAMLVGGGIVGLVVAGLGWSAPLDLKVADFGTPVVSVAVAIGISAGMIAAAEVALARAGAYSSALITRVALGGFMVVLTHAAVLTVIGFDGTGRTAAFLLALLIPWALAMVAVVTPVSLFTTGAPRQPIRPVVDKQTPEVDSGQTAGGTNRKTPPA